MPVKQARCRIEAKAQRMHHAQRQPPTKDAQTDPSPPITITSKAINRRSTPENGVTAVRIASSIPAIAAMAARTRWSRTDSEAKGLGT